MSKQTSHPTDEGASSGDDVADDAATDRDAEGVIFETTPTIKPTLLFMGLVLLTGIVVEVALVLDPSLVGGPDAASVLIYAVGFFLLVAVVRFLVRVLVLQRTRYRVTADGIYREYQLFYRHVSREIPIEKLRGDEVRQDRIQALLGYGTIRFLTGGTNDSLGYVEFEHVQDPAAIRERVRDAS